MTDLRQNPKPETHLCLNRGGEIEFRLELEAEQKGTAWIRTNIGNASVRRQSIIEHIELGEPYTAKDWHDMPMRRISDHTFRITLPLLEIGRFEAKTFFLPENSDEPVWPEGKNVIIKVEPTEYCCANTIYTAFVRQFGPNKHKWAHDNKKTIEKLEKEGY